MSRRVLQLAAPSARRLAARTSHADARLNETFLVEDSSVIRESLIAALEEMVPLKVVGQAKMAPSAQRWLDDPQNTCDLVIVDIFLRLGSGMDVLRILNERKHSAVRVVLTNYATPDVRSRCAAQGASRVFDKSSEIDELVEYCCSLQTGRRRRLRRRATVSPVPVETPPAPDLLDQPIFQGVVRQVAVRLQLQFLQHSRPVGAHRLRAEEHAVGDVADGFAFGEPQKHLQLAFAQTLVRQFFSAAGHAVGKEFSHVAVM